MMKYFCVFLFEIKEKNLYIKIENIDAKNWRSKSIYDPMIEKSQESQIT